MTNKQLREILAGLPDESEVLVFSVFGDDEYQPASTIIHGKGWIQIDCSDEDEKERDDQ